MSEERQQHAVERLLADVVIVRGKWTKVWMHLSCQQMKDRRPGPLGDMLMNEFQIRTSKLACLSPKIFFSKFHLYIE